MHSDWIDGVQLVAATMSPRGGDDPGQRGDIQKWFVLKLHDGQAQQIRPSAWRGCTIRLERCIEVFTLVITFITLWPNTKWNFLTFSLERSAIDWINATIILRTCCTCTKSHISQQTLQTSGMALGPFSKTLFIVLKRLGSVDIELSTHLTAHLSNSDVYLAITSSLGFGGILSLTWSLQSITQRWSLPCNRSISPWTYLRGKFWSFNWNFENKLQDCNLRLCLVYWKWTTFNASKIEGNVCQFQQIVNTTIIYLCTESMDEVWSSQHLLAQRCICPLKVEMKFC